MSKLLEPQFHQDAIKLILAISGLMSIAKRLMKSLPAWMPKKAWQHVQTAGQCACQWLARELTLPRRYPFAEKFAEVIHTALFYVLTLYCFLLFLTDVSLIYFGDVTAWKCVAAFTVAIVIMVMARWCFKQAEESRMKLKANSLVIW